MDKTDRIINRSKREVPYARVRRIVRCILCGHDTDELYPTKITVSGRVYNRILEIARPESHFKLLKQEGFIPQLTTKYDSVELKPIKDGIACDVNLSVCRDCGEKIRWRHKFMSKYVRESYATTKT